MVVQRAVVAGAGAVEERPRGHGREHLLRERHSGAARGAVAVVGLRRL